MGRPANRRLSPASLAVLGVLAVNPIVLPLALPTNRIAAPSTLYFLLM